MPQPNDEIEGEVETCTQEENVIEDAETNEILAKNICKQQKTGRSFDQDSIYHLAASQTRKRRRLFDL